MAAKKKRVVKKDTKKDIHKELHERLANALASYKEQLGEKKFGSKVKKAAKLFIAGLAKASKKKPAPVVVKKKPVKKKAKAK